MVPSIEPARTTVLRSTVWYNSELKNVVKNITKQEDTRKGKEAKPGTVRERQRSIPRTHTMWTSNPLHHKAPRSDCDSESQSSHSYHCKTLRETCIVTLGRWLHCVYDVGDMDCGMWLEIIKSAGKYRALPEIVSRVESACPQLECPESDEAYWRPLVLSNAHGLKSSDLVEPYPVIRDRVQTAVESLVAWRDSLPDIQEQRNLPSGGALEILEQAVVSVKLLGDTRCGHLVKSLRKIPGLDSAALRRLGDLQQRWKDYHARWEAPSSTVSHGGSNLNSQANLSRGTSLPLVSRSSCAVGPARRLPPALPVSQRVMRDLTPQELEKALDRCSSWKQLHFYIEERRETRLSM